ncbi:NDP-hexose 2,3-dehydratase family protein [Nonomuraea sp. MCN248]|uniref:NDP-hexose 2,3-dehydratase family protein n=1 Tax=Nonomuraea corallina TaxID=2989783 RepID=A0ABT4S6T8_9ACTN|nr:NDP-hexose 2,3-dehydratase family protein [Nonomuraea corallina]MDA0632763.1 NDP-hexose 2,3-dehydratase family protein [Nonomuraea corallina]
MSPHRGHAIRSRPNGRLTARIVRSMLAGDWLEEFWAWFAERSERAAHRVERASLDELAGWSRDARTGDYAHHSGKFFRVTGIDVHVPGAAVPRWSQPIIVQPEIGILGILVKEFDGVLHCLMQAKFEPGNANGLQLSPTVQATRSNFQRVHRGKAVPYLEYFRDSARHRVLADVLQSEQGAWFYQKCNRNMIVEVDGDVPVGENFRWLTFGQLNRLFGVQNLINMDARTVLSCLPFTGFDRHPLSDAAEDDFRLALARSCSSAEGSLHPMPEILSWITGIRAQSEVTTRVVPLAGLPAWHRADGRISHESGLFFDVIGVDVAAGSREVTGWSQPMIEPIGDGVVAFVVRRIGGVLHALVHARVEPGYVNVVELAPTVQCTPGNLRALPAAARPRYLDTVLDAPAEQVRYAVALSEEGGRFYRAVNTYLVVEADVEDDADYRWMPLHQLADLLKHSNYLNVQARSLVACLQSLSAPSVAATARR